MLTTWDLQNNKKTKQQKLTNRKANPFVNPLKDPRLGHSFRKNFFSQVNFLEKKALVFYIGLLREDTHKKVFLCVVGPLRVGGGK